MTGRDVPRWTDPHLGRSPRDEEYSRLTDPARWRILGARADAWVGVLTRQGLAHRDDSPISWSSPPGPEVTATERLVPRAPGALALVVARSRLGPVADGGVTLGVGRPAVGIGALPACGCDACDHGADDELERLDRHVAAIVGGSFRRLERAGRGTFPGWGREPVTSVITVLDGHGWSAANLSDTDDVTAILRDPAGWTEHAAGSCLDR